MSRGISGSARWQYSEYMSGILSRASSITSSEAHIGQQRKSCPLALNNGINPNCRPMDGSG